MLAASSEPSADPAPTSVWQFVDEDDRILRLASALSMMVLSRSSTVRDTWCRRQSEKDPAPECVCPPGTKELRRLAMRCARPSTMAVFPTPGSPMSTGYFFVRRHRICTTRSTSPSRPTSGSSGYPLADCVRSRKTAQQRRLALVRAAGARLFLVVARQFFAGSVESRNPRSLPKSQPQNTSLRRNNPSSSARFQYVYAESRSAFFSRIRQDTLAFVAQGKIDRGGNLFPDGGVTLDLFSDRFHRRR